MASKYQLRGRPRKGETAEQAKERRLREQKNAARRAARAAARV